MVEGQRFNIIQDPQMLFHVADPPLKTEASVSSFSVDVSKFFFMYRNDLLGSVKSR